MMALSLVPIALLLPLWGLISLRVAAGAGVAPGLPGAFLSVLFGCLGPYLASGSGPESLLPETRIAICMFGALLLLAAWTDHKTAWAPDGIILPLMICGAVCASLIGDLGVTSGPAIGVGLLIFGLAQALWAAQAIAGWRVLPPPDLIALSLPVLLFGLTSYTFLTFLTLSAALLFLLKAPEPVYRRIRGPAAAEAVRQAALTGEGRSAPLLPMALGSVYGVLLLRLFLG
jgi:hypothetical protein